MKNTSRYRALLASAVMLAVGAIPGCRTAATSGEERRGSQCDREAPGTLRVANSSGRILDVYVARPNGPPQLLTQVSPGTSSVTIPGPADLGARYDVIDPTARQRLASATWIRPTAREISSGVMVELICSSAMD